MERSRTDALIVDNETPDPLKLVSELRRTLYGSPVQDRENEVNPFTKSFRSHKGQSVSAHLAGDEPMGSPFSPSANMGPSATLSAISPSLLLWSPGGALPLSLSPLLMASPTPSLQPPPSAGFTNSGNPVFTLFQQAPAAAPLERSDAAPTATATGLNAPPQANTVTSSINTPPDMPSLRVAVVEPLPKTAVTPLSEHPLNETTAARDAKRKVKYQKGRDSVSILSDDSHMTGYRETGMAGRKGGGGTATRKTRPILETNDPVVRDKRRRNRIAAEKCRKRRKARQDTLETSTRALHGNYQELREKFKTLTASSKARIKQLTEENKAFKQENILLQTQLGMGALALTQQHHHQPAPLSYRPGTFFAIGQRISLQSIPNSQAPPAFPPQ